MVSKDVFDQVIIFPLKNIFYLLMNFIQLPRCVYVCENDLFSFNFDPFIEKIFSFFLLYAIAKHIFSQNINEII